MEIDSNAFCYCGVKENGVDVDVAMEGRKRIVGLDLGFSLGYDRAVFGEIMFCLLIDDDLIRGGFWVLYNRGG